MADLLKSVPRHHRSMVETTLRALRNLQGRPAVPSEHRITEPVSGVYDFSMFGYPLPITIDQLRAAERLLYVTRVHVDFSARGTDPDTCGALCVRLDLGSVPRAEKSTCTRVT